MTSPLVSIDDIPLQSWHFDAVSSRGSPFHSFERTCRQAAYFALVSGGTPLNIGPLGVTLSPIVYLLPLLIIATVAGSAELDRPEGKNCRLSEPPQSAGEEFNHGITLRIYPRARDINETYRGCQITWPPDDLKWITISVTEVVDGDPARIWSPHVGRPELTACRYKNGRFVSGVAATCAAPEFLLKKSLAPGCVKKLQEAVAVGGPGAPTPSNCGYQ